MLLLQRINDKSTRLLFQDRIWGFGLRMPAGRRRHDEDGSKQLVRRKSASESLYTELKSWVDWFLTWQTLANEVVCRCFVIRWRSGRVALHPNGTQIKGKTIESSHFLDKKTMTLTTPLWLARKNSQGQEKCRNLFKYRYVTIEQKPIQLDCNFENNGRWRSTVAAINRILDKLRWNQSGE